MLYLSLFFTLSIKFNSSTCHRSPGYFKFSWMGILLNRLKVPYWYLDSLAPGSSAFQPLPFPIYSHFLGVLIHSCEFKHCPCADHFQMSMSSPNISLNFQTLIFICLLDISIFVSNRLVHVYTKMNS